MQRASAPVTVVCRATFECSFNTEDYLYKFVVTDIDHGLLKRDITVDPDWTWREVDDPRERSFVFETMAVEMARELFRRGGKANG